ncbi:hypothetical protein H4Q26_001139 [Puccinia striiformis f. sp. tritici PST-130]|nr:hypothetical protein H4Q26_001139 [Puccinia striiformis f. sp. tritici PST-130]
MVENPPVDSSNSPQVPLIPLSGDTMLVTYYFALSWLLAWHLLHHPGCNAVAIPELVLTEAAYPKWT